MTDKTLSVIRNVVAICLIVLAWKLSYVLWANFTKQSSEIISYLVAAVFSAICLICWVRFFSIIEKRYGNKF